MRNQLSHSHSQHHKPLNSQLLLLNLSGSQCKAASKQLLLNLSGNQCQAASHQHSQPLMLHQLLNQHLNPSLSSQFHKDQQFNL